MQLNYETRRTRRVRENWNFLSFILTYLFLIPQTGNPPPADILPGGTFSPSSEPRAGVGSTRPPERGTAVSSPLIGCGSRQCRRGRGLPAESRISGPHLSEGPWASQTRESSQPPLGVPSPFLFCEPSSLNVPIQFLPV